MYYISSFLWYADWWYLHLKKHHWILAYYQYLVHYWLHKAGSQGIWRHDIDGLMQERRTGNSIANALELHLSCIKSLIWTIVCLVYSIRCDMAFIEPMHRNKPNITYLLGVFYAFHRGGYSNITMSLFWYGSIIFPLIHKSYIELAKYTPFFICELWEVRCDYFGELWLYYNWTQLTYMRMA